MRFLLISFFDESSVGLRSVGAMLVEEGHEVHLLHAKPFLYELIPFDQTDRITSLLDNNPLVARDVHALGDVFVWAHLLSDRDLELVLDHVGMVAPDVIGMSVLYARDRPAAQVSRAIARRHPELPIVWGGIYPTLFPLESLQHATMVCVGEGEQPLAEWARDPRRTDVPGLWHRGTRSPICNQPNPPPKLDTLPPPLYGHNERTLVNGTLSSRCEEDHQLIGRVYTFAASRGCRFDCSYCLSGRMRRRSKRRPRDRKSVEHFVTEVARAARQFSLPKRIGFWDDIFTEDLQWLEDLARCYPSEAGVPFACQTHPGFCPPRAVELCLQAGVEEMAIGLESGSPRTLRDVYGRHPQVERVITAAHLITDAGVPNLQIDLLTNNPWETEEDCRATLETLLRMPRPFQLELGKLVIYPGSGLAMYDGPHGGLAERDFDFWNMLYLLCQSELIEPDEIRTLSCDDQYRRQPERLRNLAHELLEDPDAPMAPPDDSDTAPIFVRAGVEGPPSGGSAMAVDVLIVGAGPLPNPDVNLTCSYQLRTAKLAQHLTGRGLETRLVAVDLLRSPEGWFSTDRSSLVGQYRLVPQDDAGRATLRAIIEEYRPRSILAVSAPAAAMVCSLDPAVPIWADMPGWLMPEAQLKAATSGNDGDLEVYAQLESTVMRRADKVSVVCDNQEHVTLGELGLLGRLSRRNLGYRFLHVLPSLALDWRELFPPPGNGVAGASDPALPDDAIVLLWSGSFNVWTDIERVFALLEGLMERMPRLHFVATGRRVPTYNDSICDHIEGLIEEAPFRDRCHLLPWLPFPDAIDWFRRADMGLCIDGENLEVPHGSRTRIVDMLAHGLPAAATVGTELTLDLQRAGAILALDPARPETWPEALSRVLSSPAELERLQTAGRDHIFAQYGLEPACRELQEWLENPSFAPDNDFRIHALSTPAAPPTEGPDALLAQERPLATWRSQAEIEAIAARALSPTFGQPVTRFARRLFGAMLGRRITRLPTLAAWNLGTRMSSWHRLPHWQSWIEALQARNSHSLGARLTADAGRRIFRRALDNGENSGTRRSLNVLLARHERDMPSGLTSLPQRIEVEPSSACNIRCRMCPLAHHDAQGSMMAADLFAKLVPFFDFAPLVEFIGRGEPTLHPDLPVFLEAATSRGSFVRMFTNGTRLSTELSTTLVRLGVNEVVLSLVAGDRQAYERITGADLFDNVVENFQCLRDVKRGSGSASPALSICCSLLRDSLDSAPGVVRTAASLGIPEVHFGAAYILKPEMEPESLLNLGPEAVESVFAECRQVAEQYGVGVTFPPVGQAPDECPQISDNRFGCLHPWLSVLVRADGNVELCSYNRKIVGDLKNQSLDQIWNGPDFAQFRQGLARHNGVDYCEMCYHRAFRTRTTSDKTHFPYGITFDGYQ